MILSQSLVSLTISLILLCPTAEASKELISADEIIKIQHLPHTSGLYFQPIKEMQFVENTWHFIVEMNHAAVFLRLKDMFDQVKNLQKFIYKNRQFKNCSSSNIIQTELDKTIMSKIVNLVNLHNDIDGKIRKSGNYESPSKYTLSRSKRGLFDPLGSLYKYLFGLMDSDDAHELHKLANGTNALNRQIKQISDHLIQFERMVEDEFDIKRKEERICEYVSTKIHLICSEIDRLDSLYDQIKDAVEDAKDKRLSSAVITAEKLLEEMKNVSNHLPKGLSWPVPLHYDNMFELIDRIINIHVFITQERKLLFIIEVPLVNQQKYDVYQIVPIPFCVKSKCAIILPDSKYLGVSKDRRNFVRFDDTRESCRLGHDMILCYVPQVVHDSNQAQLCDIRIFLKNDKDINFEKDCDVRIGKFESEIFYKITDFNRWLYVLENEVDVNFDCLQKGDNSVSANTLVLSPGIGIINATGKHTCQLSTKRTFLTTIETYNSLNKNLQMPIDTAFNLSAVLKDLDTLQLQTMKMNNDLEHNNLHKLTDRLVDLRRLMNNNTVFAGDEIQDETENSWLSNFFSSIGADFHVVKMVFVWIVLSLLALMVFKIYTTFCSGTISSMFSCCCRREDPTVIRVDREMQFMNPKPIKKKQHNQQHLLALQNKLENIDYD
uniref:Protein-F n=1 Tax=Trichoplusia ni single nucleopolyhedrovirus TaxID=332054 RepID=A0A481V7H0_9ABAC|nr:protein-F [Trichoplusia ni single nucleopolyhedrovirus]